MCWAFHQETNLKRHDENCFLLPQLIVVTHESNSAQAISRGNFSIIIIIAISQRSVFFFSEYQSIEYPGWRWPRKLRWTPWTKLCRGGLRPPLHCYCCSCRCWTWPSMTRLTGSCASRFGSSLKSSATQAWHCPHCSLLHSCSMSSLNWQDTRVFTMRVSMSDWLTSRAPPPHLTSEKQ